MATVVLLKMTSGLFWILAYGLVIRQSQRDRVSAVPIFCIWGNISFELVFALLDPSPQKAVNGIWFLQDVGIIYLAWRYRKNSYSAHLAKYFILYSSVFISAFLALFIYLTYFLLDDFYGAYIAWTLNLTMSALFIRMWVQRGGNRGQSLGIAFSKLIGSIVISPLVIPFYQSPFLTAVIAVTFILDLVYLCLVWRQSKVRIKYGELLPVFPLS
jgi:hypothetical protein